MGVVKQQNNICRDKDRTLVVGLEHFIDKIGYQARFYRDEGVCVQYLVVDNSGLSREFKDKYNADVHVSGSGVLKKIWSFLIRLLSFQPRFVEVYDTGRLTLLYVMISRLYGARVVLILRGGELNGLKSGRANSRDKGLRIAMKAVNVIVAKEHNILQALDEIGVPSSKVRFVSNAVPVDNLELPEFCAREIDVLYLNSVRASRHVEVIVRAVAALRDKGLMINVVITGFNTFDETTYQMEPEAERDVINLVKELNLEGDITLTGFVRDPKRFFLTAKLFLFPAEVVFANYALLESMSYGVVPIVANGEGASKIVSDGVNGRVLDYQVDEWAATIEELLHNRSLWQQYSESSIRKIKEEFSMRNWVSKMLDARGL